MLGITSRADEKTRLNVMVVVVVGLGVSRKDSELKLARYHSFSDP